MTTGTRPVLPVATAVAPVVDVHAHANAPVDELLAGRHELVAEQHAEVAAFGRGSMAVNRSRFERDWHEALTDPVARIDLMDRSGVDVQVVGVSPTQYHGWADPALADELTALVNEHLAAVVARTPHRLVAMAHVAFQHPDQAVTQLRHAVEHHGMRAVQVGTRSGEREFSHPDLEPFWATAEELGVLVFVHPWGCSLGPRLSPYYLGNVVGQPVETTVALSHLIFSGVLDRFPGLRVCGAHGGGYLPGHLGRADHAFDVRPESRTMLRRPSEYLSNLYVDSLVHSPEELRRLVESCGAERVLLGTDYPFDMGVTDPLARLSAAGLSAKVRRMVAGQNAADILRLTASPEDRRPGRLRPAADGRTS